MSNRTLATQFLALLATASLAAACSQTEAPAPARPAGAPPSAPAPTVAARAAAAPSAAPEERPKAQLLEQEVAYGEAERRNLLGFLAMPGDAIEPLPGIIVIHERWGLNDDIKSATRRLAAEGYVALAVDLYGGAAANTPERARKLMTAVISDPDAARANLRQAYAYLEKYALAPRIGSIGWAFGGGWSLQTALMLPDDLDAMVMYYGPIDASERELRTLKMPMLGIFASQDESIPTKDVLTFRQTLLKLGKPVDMIISRNTKPGFASPSSGDYDEKAATEAWQKTLTFFAENLKPKPH